MMLRINPYTGEPLPMNEFIPEGLQPKATALEYQPLKIPKTSYEIDDPEIPEGGNDVSFGEKLKANASGIANFGLQQYANFQNTAASTKESKMQTLGSAASGAALGLAVGGPIGAGAGAIIGGGLGLLDMKRDQNKRVEQGDREHRDKIGNRIAERKRSYYTSQGENMGNMENSFSNQKYYNPYG